MTDLVSIQNNQVVVSSRQVAEHFEKRHDNVIRDIEDVLEGILKIEEAQHLFHKTTYIHEQNNQEYPMYLMNRDGFSLLAMGFTGLKALQWKLKYIEAFNEMEDKLKAPLLNEDLETRMRIAELINNANNESRPYIIQLFKEYLPEPKPLKPNKVLDRRNKSKVLVISENKFADFLAKHSLAMRQVNRGTKISRRILRGLYHQERPRIRISTVERLCNFLNCSPDELFICE